MAASVSKISIALGRAELEWARGRAEAEGTSVSAVLTEAARAARELEARAARQQAAWSKFKTWALAGDTLPVTEVDAAARELKAASAKPSRSALSGARANKQRQRGHASKKRT